MAQAIDAGTAGMGSQSGATPQTASQAASSTTVSAPPNARVGTATGGSAGSVAAGSAADAAIRPAYQAYRILHVGFTVAPLLAGADKFFHRLVDWDQYLAPFANDLLGGRGHLFMQAVGAVEIAAGLLVALRPRLGGYVVALWLWGIIGNLLLHPASYTANDSSWGLDIALRDFGLSLGALALARLGEYFDRRSTEAP